MQHYTSSVMDTFGNAVSGATIKVYAAGTLTLSTIYSDNISTVTSNPLTSGADGSFDFYAANGRYDLVITHPSHTFTDADTAGIVLFDPAGQFFSWTPSVGGNATYSAQVGRGWKNERMVHLTMALGITTLGTGSQTTISGLDYATAANCVAQGSVGVATGLATNVVSIQPYMSAESSSITLLGFTAAATANGTVAILTDGSVISISMTYITTA